MSAIILPSASFKTNKGRKPSVPAFLFALHDDDAGGAAFADRFGNAGDMSLSVAAGADWSTYRGYFTPHAGSNNTNTQAITAAGAAQEYAAQSVLDFVTPGLGIIVAYRYSRVASEGTTTETIISWGRNNANAPCVQVNIGAQTQVNVRSRGNGASSDNTNTFGSSGGAPFGSTYTVLVHFETTATGLVITAYRDGLVVGSQQTHLWDTGGGVAPTAANVAMPDGITLFSCRAGSDPMSPSFTTRLGASTAGSTKVANVLGLRLSAPNTTTALALAQELHNFPHAVGEILAGL